MPTESLQRVKISTNVYPGYDTKSSDDEALVLELLTMWSTTTLPLLLGPLKPEVVVHFRVPSLGQMELFNHLLFCKPFNKWFILNSILRI